MSSFSLRRNARHIASISGLLNWSGRSLSGEATEAIELGGGVRVGPHYSTSLPSRALN